MTSDEQGLIQAIIADPDDDTPRLVFADYLEEQGHGAKADFIRQQIEHHPKSEFTLGVSNVYSGSSRFLTSEAEYEWREGSPYPILVSRDPHPFDLAAMAAAFGHWHAVGLNGKVSYSRGILHTVHTTTAQWCGGERCHECERISRSYPAEKQPALFAGCVACHGTGTLPGIGPALVRQQPVQRVVVSDKRPHMAYFNGVQKWRWYKGHRGNYRLHDQLPDQLFDQRNAEGKNYFFNETKWSVIWFDSEQAALDALSHALLAHARKEK